MDGLPIVSPIDASSPAGTFSENVVRYHEVPAVAESGYKGFEAATWFGVLGPAGMPKDVVAKLNAAVNAAIAEPEVTKKLADLQFIPIGKGSPAELDRFVAAEIGRWGKVVREAGVAGTE